MFKMADVAVEALEAFSNIDEVVEVISKNTQKHTTTFKHLYGK